MLSTLDSHFSGIARLAMYSDTFSRRMSGAIASRYAGFSRGSGSSLLFLYPGCQSADN